jgi:hypothetical protein
LAASFSKKTEQFEATVIATQAHRNGCQRVVLQEKRLTKEGKPVNRESVDIQTVEMRQPKDGGVIGSLGTDVLGLKAIDSSTGYGGEICVVETDSHGARMLLLQSAERTATGDRVDAVWADEDFVELLEPKKELKAKPDAPGFIDCPLSR